MIAIEHNGVCVGHLCIECHAWLIAADVFHSAHVFALDDDHRLCCFSQCLHVHHEFCFVNLWHSAIEYSGDVVLFVIRERSGFGFFLYNESVYHVTINASKSALFKFLF